MNKSQQEATDSVVPRDAVASSSEVLKALALSTEEMDELRREQTLALYRSRAILTDNERRIGRGIELEKHYRITDNKAGLAEALALQGRYSEAAEIEDRYTEQAQAVDRSDEDCSCDSFTESGDYLLPTQYIESYGHSVKHGGEMPFVRCTVCGELNALPAPKHLTEQREVRHSDLTDNQKQNYFKK